MIPIFKLLVIGSRDGNHLLWDLWGEAALTGCVVCIPSRPEFKIGFSVILQKEQADIYFKYTTAVSLSPSDSLDYLIDSLWAQEHLDREDVLRILLEAQMRFDRTQVSMILWSTWSGCSCSHWQSDPPTEFNLISSGLEDYGSDELDPMDVVSDTTSVLSIYYFKTFRLTVENSPAWANNLKSASHLWLPICEYWYQNLTLFFSAKPLDVRGF